MKLTDSAEKFLSKALGPEGFEELQKFELFKLRSNKVLDHEEIRTALQIVPRTIISLLQRELISMKEGEGKDVKLPVEPEANLHVTKFENDVYSGDISREGKVLASFQHRSLPGIGLVIMSAFELYDVNQLASLQPVQSEPMIDKIQAIIDERLGLRDLITRVVDKRISEREAIDQMVRLRLTQAMKEAQEMKDAEEPKKEAPPVKEEKAPKKLKQFLENRAKKKPIEFQIDMGKNETVICEDCKQEIFVKGAFAGCVCYGDDRDNKIFIKKNENGFSMRFPKSWDVENIQMLLETLRSKNRG